MPSIQDTAYPRFKKNISQKELEQIYTPTQEEIVLARGAIDVQELNFIVFGLYSLFVIPKNEGSKYYAFGNQIPHPSG